MGDFAPWLRAEWRDATDAESRRPWTRPGRITAAGIRHPGVQSFHELGTIESAKGRPHRLRAGGGGAVAGSCADPDSSGLVRIGVPRAQLTWSPPARDSDRFNHGGPAPPRPFRRAPSVGGWSCARLRRHHPAMLYVPAPSGSWRRAAADSSPRPARAQLRAMASSSRSPTRVAWSARAGPRLSEVVPLADSVAAPGRALRTGAAGGYGLRRAVIGTSSAA